ncbi:hypothetical protein [Roseomonas sp. AR75]|uniref:hypothetical protein n=1 Tax=Roseomonas sp. AR75 TaxID=2562311 RepID=UPI0010C02893|nr:hypothetical protein [Roseomonas sp. AR75]
MVIRLLQGLRRRPSAEPAELETFLARQAAYVAQKTVLDYCRVKVGRAEREAFADPDFQAALQHCRWQTFAASVQDVTAMLEAWLRPHAPGREPALAAALSAMAGAVLDSAPAPAEERPTLDAAREALPHHLGVLQAVPPEPADRMPLLAEGPLFATLPIPPEQRIGETPSIKGSLRFHFVAVQGELERRFDAAALAARLTG